MRSSDANASYVHFMLKKAKKQESKKKLFKKKKLMGKWHYPFSGPIPILHFMNGMGLRMGSGTSPCF